MTLKFSIAADAPEAAAVPSIVVGVYEDRSLTPSALRIDERSGGALTRLLESSDANGKAGSVAALFHLPNIVSPRVVLAGLGEQKKLDAAAYYRAQDWPRLISLWKNRADAPNASVETLFGLAAAYYAAGQNQNAIHEVNYAVSIYPQAKSAGDAAIAQIEAGK